MTSTAFCQTRHSDSGQSNENTLPCQDEEIDAKLFFVAYGRGQGLSMGDAQIIANKDAQKVIDYEVTQYLKGIYGNSKKFEFKMPSTSTVCKKVDMDSLTGLYICYCAVTLEKTEIDKILDSIKISDE